jgi:hypothetical protein
MVGEEENRQFMFLGNSGEPYDVITDIDEESTKCILRAPEKDEILPNYHRQGRSNMAFNVLKGFIGDEEIVIIVNAPNEIAILQCRG